MISAAGIKDQELTIIVSMMLIELALLRLSGFKRLVLLDTHIERIEIASILAYVIGLVTTLALSAAYNICPLRPLRDAGLGSRALAFLQLVSRTCR